MAASDQLVWNQAMVPRSPHAPRAGCPVGAGAEHCRAPKRTAPRKPGQGYGLTYLHHKFKCFWVLGFRGREIEQPCLSGRGGVRLGAGSGVSRLAAVVCWGCCVTPRGVYMGCPPYPKAGHAWGARVMKNSRNTLREVYKIIHNVNLNRLTLKMA